MSLPIDHSFTSDNHSERGTHTVQLLLLHATVGSLRSSLDWLCDPASEVSTHYEIAKSGKIYQLVQEDKCAWHAGKAIWRGETKVNEISIGIELENMTGVKGFKGQDPYPDMQVQALTALVHDILPRYRLTPDSIARHLDVATPPGRKTDPAGFPFIAWRDALVVPASRAYQVVGLPVYQAQSLAGAVAGTLSSGETVLIDQTYSNGAGHLKSGLGFVDLDGLKAL